MTAALFAQRTAAHVCVCVCVCVGVWVCVWRVCVVCVCGVCVCYYSVCMLLKNCFKIECNKKVYVYTYR